MKFRFLIIIILLSTACAGKRMVMPSPMASEVHFGFAKDRIKPTETSNLNQSIAFLKNYPSKMVIVEGHTDPIGDGDYNLELGDRRAREVKHFLITQGVAPEQIIVVSFGEENLRDDHNFAMNRRAVIRLTNGGLQ